MAEVGRILTACLIILDDECLLGELDVRRQLSRLDNSYGCWLDQTDAAILNAALPDEQHRMMIYGAFRMAKSYIFEFEGYNAHHLPAEERATGRNSGAVTFRRLAEDQASRFSRMGTKVAAIGCAVGPLPQASPTLHGNSGTGRCNAG